MNIGVKNWLRNLVLCFLIVGALPFGVDFSGHGSVCRDGEKCESILQCTAYQSAADIHRCRPTPCGFSGHTPLVCCPQPATVKPPIAGGHDNFHLLPEECGDPRRNLYNVPRPTRPPCMEEHSSQCPQDAVGGFRAVEGKWPWMVLLGRWSEQGDLGDWFCGGTLITDRHVLTAAHCLQPEQLGTVGARLGDYDLADQSDVIHQDRNISRITRHERYRGAQNDIALVRLDRPADPSKTIRPICLPAAGAEHDGRDVDMAGWGYLEFAGEVPDVLQEVPLRVSDVIDCERAYRDVPQYEVRFPGGFQDTKICALSRDGEPRDACPGDSGGPLMAKRSEDLYELVGVVSTGVGCGNPEFPGIYTKVSAYIDWILRNLT